MRIVCYSASLATTLPTQWPSLFRARAQGILKGDSLRNIHLDLLRTKQFENSFTDLHYSCAEKKGKGGRERKAEEKESERDSSERVLV